MSPLPQGGMDINKLTHRDKVEIHYHVWIQDKEWLFQR